MSTLLAEAKQHHVQAWVMTLLPRVGSLQWTATTEQGRLAITRTSTPQVPALSARTSDG